MGDTEIKTESTEVKVEVKNEASEDKVDAKVEAIETKTQCKIEETVPKKEKSEPEEDDCSEPTQLEQKIIRQIEYYFGDHNLTKDKFMQGQLKEDDGWIPLTVLMTFNRLKTLSDEPSVVLKALKKSTADLIEINEEKDKIRRNPDRALPPKRESWKDEEWNRTVYVKGFPVDSTIDLIQDYFAAFVLKVSSIYMRKNFHSKSFKGSVFATFETREDAEAFHKMEGLKFKNTVLVKEMRHSYQIRKDEEFRKRREEREQRKLEKEEKDKETPDETPVKFDPNEDMVKGCILKLSGFAEGTPREHIKDKFAAVAKVAYVDFKIGDETAYVRFEEADSAKDALEKAKTGLAEDEEGGKKLIVNGAELTTSILEGEEEVEYWRKLVQARSNYIKERKGHKRHGGFSGRGGRGSKGGRGGWRGRGGRDGGRGRGGRDGGRGGHNRRDRKRGAGDDSEENGVSEPKRPAESTNESLPVAASDS